jgi:hypothetical protein
MGTKLGLAIVLVTLSVALSPASGQVYPYWAENIPENAVPVYMYAYYDLDTGEILSVTYTVDIPMFYIDPASGEILWPEGMGDFAITGIAVLDNHPLKHDIFARPSHYIYDLETGEVRSATAAERAEILHRRVVRSVLDRLNYELWWDPWYPVEEAQLIPGALGELAKVAAEYRRLQSEFWATLVWNDYLKDKFRAETSKSDNGWMTTLTWPGLSKEYRIQIFSELEHSVELAPDRVILVHLKSERPGRIELSVPAFMVDKKELSANLGFQELELEYSLENLRYFNIAIECPQSGTVAVKLDTAETASAHLGHMSPADVGGSIGIALIALGARRLIL